MDGDDIMRRKLAENGGVLYSDQYPKAEINQHPMRNRAERRRAEKLSRQPRDRWRPAR